MLTVPHLRRPLHAVRRRLLVHRRLIAALCLATAAGLALEAARPSPPPTRPLWVAAHPLAAGTVLERGDLRRIEVDRSRSPAGVTDPGPLLRRTLLRPLARDEALTTGAVSSPGFLADPGRRAVAVRLSDAGLRRLLRPGDVVDLVAADPRTGTAGVVAEGATVLTTVAEPEGDPSPRDGVLVLVAVDDADASAVIAATAARFLSATWNR